MTLRWLPRVVLITALLGASGWAVLDRDAADALPLCRAGEARSTHAPATPPSLTAGGSCRARPTSIQRVRPTTIPRPAGLAPGLVAPSAYHHLGVTTADTWSGVLGRILVRDVGVRAGTLDFTAARFMARRDGAEGTTSWLEAGWAETGWAGDGRQRIYTYDTNRNAWTFFDDYKIADGDRIWIYLEAAPESTREDQDANWQAWLWWGDKWHLLASQKLPLTGAALVEQYVEVYADAKQAGTYPVPTVAFDNVQVKPQPTADPIYWREADVPTNGGGGTGQYCVNWVTRFDTWSAGDCP